jgi:hypothetical protein
MDRYRPTALVLAGLLADERIHRPLLASAFPNGDGVVATSAQRDFLKALVANDWLWDLRCGNAINGSKRQACPVTARRVRN